MRFLIASLAIGFLAVGPAAAQEKMTIHEYVDAHRPKIEKRPLTADEKAAFNPAVRNAQEDRDVDGSPAR